jgi:hypothetical protein
LIKWDKAKVGYYVGVDIAEGSVSFYHIHLCYMCTTLQLSHEMLYFSCTFHFAFFKFESLVPDKFSIEHDGPLKHISFWCSLLFLQFSASYWSQKGIDRFNTSCCRLILFATYFDVFASLQTIYI